MNKIFIIGLPRTGTTSISIALLQYNFKVAHTAYTKRAFELADVISDAPCFCDYQQLDALFPGSKFVYVERDLNEWISSIQMLLKKMLPELTAKTGYLHPVLKRCINKTFALSTTTDPLNERHLEYCYANHKNNIVKYFMGRNDLLTINLSQSGNLKKLLKFLDRPLTISTECINNFACTNNNPSETHNVEVHNAEKNNEFPHVNIGKQVDYWKHLKHPNKINSLSAGIEHKKFFDYHNNEISIY